EPGCFFYVALSLRERKAIATPHAARSFFPDAMFVAISSGTAPPRNTVTIHCRPRLIREWLVGSSSDRTLRSLSSRGTRRMHRAKANEVFMAERIGIFHREPRSRCFCESPFIAFFGLFYAAAIPGLWTVSWPLGFV